MEEVEIEVWWPKDTGPFRHRPERQREQTGSRSHRRDPAAKPARGRREARRRAPRGTPAAPWQGPAPRGPARGRRGQARTPGPQAPPRGPQARRRGAQAPARKAHRPQFALCRAGRPQGASLPASEATAPRQRLDKWLWIARVVKTREAAAGLVEAGHVRINRPEDR